MVVFTSSKYRYRFLCQDYFNACCPNRYLFGAAMGSIFDMNLGETKAVAVWWMKRSAST
jgi:hypothetical protein